jgi:hypothetical protein
MGSAAAAAWIGHFVYWVLIIWGVATESLSVRAFVVFLLLWLVPFFTLDYFPAAAPFFSPYVAVLDIVLVFLLFRGDVRLT